MNPNPPHDNINTREDTLPVIINIQRRLRKGIIKTNTGKKFPVTLQEWLVKGISLYDYVELKKSVVTAEWIVTDYFINHEVYAPIHNSYQTSLDDMILDEKGVPL